MKVKISVYILFVIVVAIVGFGIWRGSRNGNATSVLDDFVKCLAQKGAVVYGTDSCEWCLKQKADFGNSWQFINYANCIKDPQRCVAAKIESTPTWIFADGKRIVGYQTLEKLSEASGCVLPEINK